MRDVALIGLPFSGRSTIFNAVARQHAATGGAAKRANVAQVTVPDERVDELARIHSSKTTVYERINLTDVAGLDPRSLADVREADALAIVLRAFGHDADPARDLEKIRSDLAVADLQTIEKVLERVARQAKSGDKRSSDHADLFARAEAVLSDGRWLVEGEWTPEDAYELKLLTPLTMEPVLHVVSVDEAFASDSGDHAWPNIPDPVIVIKGLVEAEAADLDPVEAADLLAEFGVHESATARFVRAVYDLLDLVTFYTAGEKEACARAIPRGTSAKKAAGTIHTDLERGFIKAEITAFADLLEAGSEEAAARAGKVRTEGRDYVVQEADVALFRHST